MSAIDTTNRWGVSALQQKVIILVPPARALSGDEALVLAAWLVTLAARPRADFDAVLDAVQST